MDEYQERQLALLREKELALRKIEEVNPNPTKKSFLLEKLELNFASASHHLKLLYHPPQPTPWRVNPDFSIDQALRSDNYYYLVFSHFSEHLEELRNLISYYGT